MDRAVLARRWIEAQGNPDLLNKLGEEAIDEVIDLAVMDPEELWLLILQMLSLPESEKVIGSIGAGPLEDLIADYGLNFIDRIQSEYEISVLFREALKHVWVGLDVKPDHKIYEALGCKLVSTNGA